MKHLNKFVDLNYFFMQNLLSLKFWFKLRPGLFLPVSQKTLIGIIIGLAVLAVIFNLLGKKNKNGLYVKVWNNLYSFSLTNAFIFLLLLFFNYELVPFLSARFWYLLVGLEMAIWIFFIARNLFLIPKKKERYEKEKEYKKYIP